MAKEIVKMEMKGLAVLATFKHDNGANPRLGVTPIYGGNYDEEITIPKAKLILDEAKGSKEIEKLMNAKSRFSYSLSDSRQIYLTGNRLRLNGGNNVADRMSFNQLLESLFDVYKKSNWEEPEEGQLCTEAYIRAGNDKEPYFCIPWNHVKDILHDIDPGWTPKQFREQAGDYCELWAGTDQIHWNLYQCPSRNEKWSLRIKMTTDFFSKDDIEKVKEIEKKGDSSNGREQND